MTPRSTTLRLSFLLSLGVAALVLPWSRGQDADDLEGLQEKAMKAAVLKVGPSVVQIETTGGADIIGTGPMQIRKGVGPTTGLIVAADGYVISSAFNFANKPAGIFVAVPGHKERYPAKLVATDHTRMLTLLKIEAANLPVPAYTPKNDIKVGQWSLALGRTWATADSPPSVSVGIISAVNRIWGKAIQTDSKVSPVNYGGPLVDILGRVQGVLVPASPRAEGESAGVEWYDSGIGFAIPLQDINAVLPRMKQGQDLQRGMLGITMQGADMYGPAPTIANVAPESAAAKAGIQTGDTIITIDGAKVLNQSQVRHALGNKYEGDSVNVKVKRGDKEIGFANVKLGGAGAAFIHSFLGILPMRDDPELGVEVRYVFPKSPADAAGIKPGDRIMKIGQGKNPPQAFSGRDQLQALFNNLTPGTEITLERQKKGEKTADKVTLKLGPFAETVLDQLPEPATLKKALAPRKTVGPVVPPVGPKPPIPVPPKKEEPKKEEPKKEEPKKEEKKEPAKKAETGFLERSNTARDHRYWIYVPEDYDPNIAHALVIWLHPAGKGGGDPKEKDAKAEKEAKAFKNTWEDYCSSHHVILVMPQSQNERGWLFSESDFVQETARQVMAEYTIDRQRVIAHGMGVGGQMAFYLGFQARDLIRGVATTGAILASQPKENLAAQRLAFFVVAGEKDPIAKQIAETKTKLLGQKFPVVHKEIKEMGHQYLTEDVLIELVRWIDALDRL